MIPFSIKVFFFKVWQFLLKISTPLLRFRTPELFSGPGSSLQHRRLHVGRWRRRLARDGPVR